MSEQTETSADEDGERGISVRRLAGTYGVTSRQITRAVRAALGDQPVRTVSVAIVDDATITSLHERYLGDARPTDVLAFDLRDDPNDERIEGEIIVSAETVGRQAKDLGVAAAEELLRCAIHGALHLTGRDDATPAQRRQMRQAEDLALAGLARKRSEK